MLLSLKFTLRYWEATQALQGVTILLWPQEPVTQIYSSFFFLLWLQQQCFCYIIKDVALGEGDYLSLSLWRVVLAPWLHDSMQASVVTPGECSHSVNYWHNFLFLTHGTRVTYITETFCHIRHCLNLSCPICRPVWLYNSEKKFIFIFFNYFFIISIIFCKSIPPNTNN